MLLNLSAYSKDVVDVLESITVLGTLLEQNLKNISGLSRNTPVNRLFELLESAILNEGDQEEDLNSLAGEVMDLQESFKLSNAILM